MGRRRGSVAILPPSGLVKPRRRQRAAFGHRVVDGLQLRRQPPVRQRHLRRKLKLTAGQWLSEYSRIEAMSACESFFDAQRLAFPVFHCSQGMFQSPRPSVPGRVGPVVLMTSTMSPRRVLS